MRWIITLICLANAVSLWPSKDHLHAASCGWVWALVWANLAYNAQGRLGRAGLQ